jgi:AraC family transcriptional regulator of arabinose operon
MEKKTRIPMVPFTRLKFVSYGPRIHRPTVWPWIWDVTIPHFNFWFQTEGAGRLICRGKEYRLEPGTCFLFTPGSKVWATNDDGAGMANFSAHFFPAFDEKVSPRKVEPIFGRKVRRMKLFLELSQDIVAAFRRNDVLGRHEAEWGLLTMIYHLWREAFNSPQADLDEEIVEVLDQAAHSGWTETSVPELARKVGLSASQFTRRVQAITDDSPANYIIRERISHACFLLIETSKSVKMIADNLGYSDTSYFVRQFRTIMHTTPSQYRKEHLRI